MPDVFYARGRIIESIQYISDELKEFEVSGTLATQKAVKVENYADALHKASELLGFTQEDREKLGKLAAQRNRLAHRYLNFRWQVIRVFKENKPLVVEFVRRVVEMEKERQAQENRLKQAE